MRTSRMWPLSTKRGAATASLAAMNIFVSDIAIVGNTPLTDLNGTNVHVMHG